MSFISKVLEGKAQGHIELCEELEGQSGTSGMHWELMCTLFIYEVAIFKMIFL